MKKIIALVLLVASCSPGESQQGGGNDSAAEAGQAAPPRDAKAGGPRIASLVGLYEAGEGTQKHQMCIVEGKSGHRFGVKIWGSSMHSCSGSGTAVREGDRLKLSMSGDAACTVEATIDRNRVKMPEGVPEGCSYYCGAQATFGGVELAQTGSNKADAMRATDFVGEPLCEGS
ncbi:MAG TPA: hypothetical protein VNT25_03120 [Allosphingosinicella sp.]|nr:hypothetical protein [Allosphingosinicella sp.]